MAGLTMHGSGNASQIAELLAEEIQNSAMSCELIHSTSRLVNGVWMYVMVFEKYYFRSSNRASLTVALSVYNDELVVDIIGAGGGQGALFRFSWGTEEDFVASAQHILQRHGFV